MGELAFDETTHTYTIDGLRIANVTEIIAPLGSPMSESLELVFEAAAERGTILHKVLELFLTGDFDIEYPDAYSGYIDAITLFMTENDITPCQIERPVYNEFLHYAGTPDLVCFFNGKTTILDYKFVAQVEKTKVKAQLNAYRLAYESIGIDIEALYVIQFMDTGKYRLYPVAIGDNEFLLCLELYKLKNKKHSRGRID
ncbi:hypothetical protein LJB89_01605 [Tyzzerella sp. OttesenSCG-928-J15]|nr:hypothetical protein [Tyzzerella sp. OttesenSCG-928-J15]